VTILRAVLNAVLVLAIGIAGGSVLGKLLRLLP
jgi:hypothetical protein